jgi:hypothetical protein
MTMRVLIMAGGRGAEGAERPHRKCGLGLGQTTEVAPGTAAHMGTKQ